MAGLLFWMSTAGTGGLQAQTDLPPQESPLSEPLFAPRPGVIDYGRYYTRVEDCLAAVERVRDSVHWGTARVTGDPSRWQEVLTALDARQPEPAPVGQTALRCGARFPIAAADSVALPFLEEIYYTAPDSVLDGVLARWQALVPAGASARQRAEPARRMLGIVIDQMRPGRIEWAERRLGDIVRFGPDGREARLHSYLALMRVSREVGDTVRADRYAHAFLALGDSLRSPAESELTRRRFDAVRLDALQYQRERALAHGRTVEPLGLYYARHAARAQNRDLSPADSSRAVSALAPPIEATFWFRRPDSSTPRPTRGKFGFVLFVDPDCRPCYRQGEYAVLRELGQRFGDALEITLVGATKGFFRNYPPPSPAEEAEHLRRYFFEHLKFRGALAVEVSRFSCLPAPDRRRVQQLSGNYGRYQALTPIWNQGVFPHGFLVGPDGQVLFAVSLDVADRHALMAVIAGQLAPTPQRSN